MLRKILKVLAVGTALAIVPTVAWAAASGSPATDDCCCPLCCHSK